MSKPLPANKNRLGRGLASLIGDTAQQGMAGAEIKAVPNHGEQRMVPIDRINPSPFNPRKTFDSKELDELAESITKKAWCSRS